MLPVFKLRYCKIIPDIHLLVKARMIATTSLTYTGQPNSIVMEEVHLFSFREDTINPLHQLRATPLVMYKVIIISHLSIAFLSWKNIIIPIKLSISVTYPSYKKVPHHTPPPPSPPSLSPSQTCLMATHLNQSLEKSITTIYDFEKLLTRLTHYVN